MGGGGNGVKIGPFIDPNVKSDTIQKANLVQLIIDPFCKRFLLHSCAFI